MKPNNAFPFTVKEGSVTVKIYFQPNHRDASYVLTWYASKGKRRRQRFADFAKAKAEAQSIARKLCRGEAQALTLTNADRTAYVRAIETLKPSGVPLELAAMSFAEARKVLGSDNVVEAARFYAKHHPRALPQKLLPQVLEEFLQEKKKQQLSEAYLADLRYRCGSFARAFQSPIASITVGEIREFLDDLNLTARSHNNFLRTLGTMFEFAKARGYLPKTHDELAGIKPMKDRGGAIQIYTVSEIARLLSAAPENFLPSLAIAAFAGLRSAEIERLVWEEVHLPERFIEVTAGKSKTASRRLAPVTDNLAAWLAPRMKREGKVWMHSHPYFYCLQYATAEATGGKQRPAVEWKHNALRHSFISYRVAQTQNVAQVALEAGNSPQMIFSNYRELVTREAAAKWFSIEPANAKNVIELPKAANG